MGLLPPGIRSGLSHEDTFPQRIRDRIFIEVPACYFKFRYNTDTVPETARLYRNFLLTIQKKTLVVYYPEYLIIIF